MREKNGYTSNTATRYVTTYPELLRQLPRTELYAFIFWSDDRYLHDRWFKIVMRGMDEYILAPYIT
jgi:hypothetical protein